MTYDQKVAAVLLWADQHPDFDARFVEKMADELDQRGQLTERQEVGIDNIIEGWKIPVEEYLD